MYYMQKMYFYLSGKKTCLIYNIKCAEYLLICLLMAVFLCVQKNIYIRNVIQTGAERVKEFNEFFAVYFHIRKGTVKNEKSVV